MNFNLGLTGMKLANISDWFSLSLVDGSVLVQDITNKNNKRFIGLHERQISSIAISEND